jgi:ribosomal protein S27E
LVKSKATDDLEADEEADEHARQQEHEQSQREMEAQIAALYEWNRKPVRYTCPDCAQCVWAEPGTMLICGSCSDAGDLCLMLPDVSAKEE